MFANVCGTVFAGTNTEIEQKFRQTTADYQLFKAYGNYEDYAWCTITKKEDDETGAISYEVSDELANVMIQVSNIWKQEEDEKVRYQYFKPFVLTDVNASMFSSLAEFNNFNDVINNYFQEFSGVFVYYRTSITPHKIYCYPCNVHELGFYNPGYGADSCMLIASKDWIALKNISPKIQIQQFDLPDGKKGASFDIDSYANLGGVYSLGSRIGQYKANDVYGLFVQNRETFKVYTTLQDLKEADSNTVKPSYYIINNDTPGSYVGPVTISQDEIDNSIHYGDIDNSLTQYINENHYNYSGISEETLQAIIQMIINQFKNQPTPVNPTPTNPTPSDPIYIGGGGGISSNIIIHNNNNNYWTIGGSASDNSVSGNGWNLGGFFGGASSFLHAFVEGLLNLIGTLLGQLESLMTLISEFIPRIVEAIPTAMTDLMAAVFPFLPEEVGLAISLSVVLLLVSVVIKMFRG